MEQGAFWAMAPVLAGSAASLDARRNRIFGPVLHRYFFYLEGLNGA